MGWPFGRAVEERSVSFQDVFGRGDSVDLLMAGVESALRLVPVYAATRLIADQFASAPLRSYRERPDGTTERVNPQPQLMLSPSALGHTAFTWKYQAITSALLRGFALGLITSVDSQGWASAVEWVHPDKTSIDDSDPRRPVFYYDGRRLDPNGIVYVPAYIVAGKWKGVSPITAFKTALQTGDLAQQSAHGWFKNGMAPAGHLKNTTQTLDATEADTAKKRFKASIQNRDVMVTGKDWSFDTIAVAADEARFIEMMKLTATQVASIYGVPAELIGGETGGSLTYNTPELNGLNLAKIALRPWFVRFEEAIGQHRPPGEYAKFNADAIVRADLKTRMEAHQIAITSGVETLDEARRLEDKAPLTVAERSDMQGQATNMLTVANAAGSLIRAGYVPDSVTAALTTGDMSLLKHSGLVPITVAAPTDGTDPEGGMQA